MDLLLTAPTLAEPAADLGSHVKLLTYIAVALGISFLCSIWEAVLLATPRSHVELMVEAGSRGGAHLRRMRQNVEQPISAILTLNTIAHTVGAAGAGAEATIIFGSAYFGVISAVLTLLILVFSEIIPKTIGTTYCRSLAGMTGVSVHALVRLFYPFIRLMELLTRLLKPKKKGPSVSRAELQAMAALSAAEGGIRLAEQRTVDNLLRLEQIKVRDVMTPRTVIFSLAEGRTVGEVLDGEQLPPFSRIPITPGGADDIRGYVLRQDLLERAADGDRDVVLADLARPMDVVPQSSSVAHALDLLSGRREHILLVADEFGGTAGLITLEDAMETLLGREIMDELDRVADLQELARRRTQQHRAALRGSGGDAEPRERPESGRGD
jgi:CBS domain containing-hemolysin-like protein